MTELVQWVVLQTCISSLSFTHIFRDSHLCGYDRSCHVTVGTTTSWWRESKEVKTKAEMQEKHGETGKHSAKKNSDWSYRTRSLFLNKILLIVGKVRLTWVVGIPGGAVVWGRQEERLNVEHHNTLFLTFAGIDIQIISKCYARRLDVTGNIFNRSPLKVNYYPNRDLTCNMDRAAMSFHASCHCTYCHFVYEYVAFRQKCFPVSYIHKQPSVTYINNPPLTA